MNDSFAEVKDGLEMTLLYPVVNRLGVPLEHLERHVQVTSFAPHWRFDVESVLRRPLCRRGVWLASGTDLAIGKQRSFWIEAANGNDLPFLGLGLVDPHGDPDDMVDTLDDSFAPTVYDRLRMKRAILEYRELVKDCKLPLKLIAYVVRDRGGTDWGYKRPRWTD